MIQCVYEDYEPGQRWPAHPDDEHDEDPTKVVESLEELSGLSGSSTEKAPIQLDANDLKLQR